MKVSRPTQIFLSWGMGADSTAILVRWLTDPSSRNFPLSALTVLTAQTGNEWPDTKALCEKYVLPLLRQHRVRLVQVARGGQFEEHGIEVLDDTRQPEQMHIEGAYTLAHELQFAGTVPQFAGIHTCALKFKAFVLETWLQLEAPKGQIAQAFGYSSDEQRRVEKSEYAIAKRIAFGFSADEKKRAARANEYDSFTRESFYPLLEWNWTREDCLSFLRDRFGITFSKSACTFCPFVSFKDNSLQRFEDFPEDAARALLLEYTSLCFNHRATLYKNRSLMSILRKASNQKAIEAFRNLKSSTPTATYRVRRIMTSKGHGHRCTELLDQPLIAVTREKGLTPRVFHLDDYEIETAYAIERDETTFPAREEFYVRAPATVASRARYGLPWFEDKWRALDQVTLF